MTIPKLQLSNLVNSDHINLMEFTVKATDKYPYIGEILPDPVAFIKEAYDKENDAYLKSNRSFLTKQIQAANEQRILRFREVNNLLKGIELCGDPKKAEDARFLLDIIHDYGGATKIIGSRVDSLSGILTNLVEDFQKRFPEKVEAVGATHSVEELKVANETYKTLRSDRTEEVSEVAKKAMRESRAFCDTCWRGLIDVINWRYFYKQDAQMLPFMRYMTTEVDWYRTLLGQKPGNPNANPDGGAEGDGEAQPPTGETPTTPPAEDNKPETPPADGDNTGDNNESNTGSGNTGSDNENSGNDENRSGTGTPIPPGPGGDDPDL